MVINTSQALLNDIPRIGVDAYATLHILAKHMDIETRKCFPSKDLLMNATGLSKDRLYAALRRLIDHGYISAEQQKNENGQFKKIVYTVHEGVSVYLPDNQEVSPCAGKPVHGFPEHGFPVTGNPTTINYIHKEQLLPRPADADVDSVEEEPLNVKKTQRPPRKIDGPKIASRDVSTAFDKKREAAGLPGLVWNEKEFSNLRRLMEALRKMGQPKEWTADVQIKYLERYFDICIGDEWMSDKMVPTMMYSQFNAIMTKYTAKKAKAAVEKTKEIIPPYLRKITQ